MHFSNLPTNNWKVNDPWSKPDDMFKVIQLEGAKHFAALMLSLTGRENNPLFTHPPVNKFDIIQVFHEDLALKWKNGHNIILGSEEVDNVVADNLNGVEVMDQLLSILPPNYKDVMSVVVTYRAPKSKHLESLWKEVIAETPGADGGNGYQESFKEFLFNPESFEHFHAIDVMPLVDMFLERGVRVVLVDLTGLKMQGVQSYQLLGCDLMHEICDENMVPNFLQKHFSENPEFKDKLQQDVNVRSSGIMDLTENQIDDIEVEMQSYDCAYKHLLNHENLSILYDNALGANMRKCSSKDASVTNVPKRKTLWNNIKAIADSEQALDDKKRKIILFAGPHFSSSDFMVSEMYNPFLIGKMNWTHPFSFALIYSFQHILSIHFSAILNKKWTWLAPSTLDTYFQLDEPSYFAALMFVLSGEIDHPLFTRPVTSDLIYGIFQQEMNAQLATVKNILLGSEEVDRITADFFDISGKDIIGKLLPLISGLMNHGPEQTPYEDDSDDKINEVSVVVGYTSPRINHLISLWKEVGKPQNLSFSDFVLDSNSVMHLHTIDPLHLAEVFLNHGTNVILVDVAGYQSAGVKPYQVMACDIMKETCDEKHYPHFIDEHRMVHPDIMNVIDPGETMPMERSNEVDPRLATGLNENQIDAIEKELQKYDCQFSQIISHRNITILYDSAFSANMNRCLNHEKINRKEMWKRIAALVDPAYFMKQSLSASFMKSMLP